MEPIIRKPAEYTEQEQAVGYVRVSTNEQAEEGISLDAQEKKIRAYAAMRGLRLVKVFREEAVSASKVLAKRPEGKLFVDTLNQHQNAPRHVITFKLDRLFRRASDALVRADEWDKAGIALHILDMSGETVNTRSAMGKMFFTMTAGFAERERNLTSERTRAALAHMRTEGGVYCGVAPLGFDKPPGYDALTPQARKAAKLIPNQQELSTVKRIRRMRKAGWQLQKIANKLNHTKTPTKRGGR